MKKNLSLLVICVGLYGIPFAQSSADSLSPFINSTGTGKKIGYMRYGFSVLLPFNQQGNPVIFPGLTIAPGLRVFQTNDFIFSLSFPITAWGTFKYDYLLGIDIPAMIDINIGAAAAGDQRSKMGYIVGFGYGYIDAVNNYDNEEGMYKRSDFWSWRIEFGIDIGKENNDNDRDILFLNYGRSLSDRRFWMVGLSLQVMMHKL
jgi:hypothetical protein